MTNLTDRLQAGGSEGSSAAVPMRAVQYARYGAPDVLTVTTVAIPEIRKGTALVRVRASSVNAGDVDIRAGKLKLLTGRRFPRGTGFDFAGEVVNIGEGVDGLRAGDAVWGFLNGIRQGPSAATAEYVVAPVDRVTRAPQSIDAVGAAALAGAGGAAVGALEAAAIRPGDRVLIRGAAGGVGSAAVQLATAMGGHVTALVRATHLDRVRELGAEVALDYNTTTRSELGSFDVILDTVGKDMRRYRRLLAPGGRMITITPGSPREAAYMLASRVFGKRRIRFVQSPPDNELLTALAAHVEARTVVPVIDNVYPLDDIAAAHRAIEAGGAFGKQVVRVA